MDRRKPASGSEGQMSVPLGYRRLRCVDPGQHWEFQVGIGHQVVRHELHGDEQYHCVLVPKGEHALALMRAGYTICND
jgi:hypothetical protein